MAILFKMESRQVQLLDGRDFSGGRRFCGGLGQRGASLFFGPKSNYFPSVGGKHSEEHGWWGAVRRQLDAFDEGLTRLKILSFL